MSCRIARGRLLPFVIAALSLCSLAQASYTVRLWFSNATRGYDAAGPVPCRPGDEIWVNYSFQPISPDTMSKWTTLQMFIDLGSPAANAILTDADANTWTSSLLSVFAGGRFPIKILWQASDGPIYDDGVDPSDFEQRLITAKGVYALVGGPDNHVSLYQGMFKFHVGVDAAPGSELHWGLEGRDTAQGITTRIYDNKNKNVKVTDNYLVVASGPWETTTTLAESQNPCNVGQHVTLTATTSPAPTGGSVEFRDGSTVIATVPIVSGAAVTDVSYDAPGVHQLTATYTGSDFWAPSFGSATLDVFSSRLWFRNDTTGQEGPGDLTVHPGDQVSLKFQFHKAPGSADTWNYVGGLLDLAGGSIVGDSDANAWNGQVLAGFSPASAFPVHVVWQPSDGPIRDNATNPGDPNAPPATAKGLYLRFAVDQTSAAAQDLDATLFTFHVPDTAAPGDALDWACRNRATDTGITSQLAAGGGQAYDVMDNRLVVASSGTPTTTSLSAAPAICHVGEAVALTAVIFPTPDGGQVEFRDGTTVLGTEVVSGGRAVLNLTFARMGLHDVVARYGGSAVFAPSSGNTTVDVLRAGTTTSLAVVPSLAHVGETVTMTASIAPVPDGGNVQFLDGTTPIGSVPVVNGTATLQSTFAAGIRTIAAAFSGTANYAPSAGTGPLDVEKFKTSTHLDATPNPARVGESVTLTATVTPGVDEGSVEITDNGASLGTFQVNAPGVVTLHTLFAVPDSHTLVAHYLGTPGFAESSGSVTLPVVDARLWFKNETTGDEAPGTVRVHQGDTVSVNYSFHGGPSGKGGRWSFMQSFLDLADPAANGILTDADANNWNGALTSLFRPTTLFPFTVLHQPSDGPIYDNAVNPSDTVQPKLTDKGVYALVGAAGDQSVSYDIDALGFFQFTVGPDAPVGGELHFGLEGRLTDTGITTSVETNLNRRLAVTDNWLVVTSNRSPATVSGKVALEDWLPSPDGQQVEFWVLDGTGAVVRYVTAALDADGGYSISFDLAGPYTLRAKGSHWLSQSQANVLLDPSQPVVASFSLLNGDVDGDNHISIMDLSLVLADFEAFGATPCDLNGDGAVGIADLSVVLANFNLRGD